MTTYTRRGGHNNFSNGSREDVPAAGIPAGQCDEAGECVQERVRCLFPNDFHSFPAAAGDDDSADRQHREVQEPGVEGRGLWGGSELPDLPRCLYAESV